MTLDSPLSILIIACCLGGFLGLRREIVSQERQTKNNFIGFRTMTLISALGAISTFIPSLPYLPIVLFSSLMILIGIAYAYGSFKHNLVGLTTEISAIMIFWVGALVGFQQAIPAIFITLLLAGINAYRDEIRKFAGTINKKEWDGALQLLFVSGAILPFLPTTAIDPWGIVIPFSIWKLVIFISGIGFLGYFLTKYIGTKGGIPIVSFLGAIVSSTAVTTSMAEQSKRSNLNGIFAVGIMIGIATMQARVFFEIVFLGPKDVIFQTIYVPIAMGIAAVLAALYFFKRTVKKHKFSAKKEKPSSDLNLKSPFEIIPALKFGALYVVVLASLAMANKYLGEYGVYATAALAGFVDADAIVLSNLQAVKLGETDSRVASIVIMIAIFVNTAVKIFYVFLLGSKKLAKKVAFGTSFVLFIGLLAMFLSFYL